MRSTFIIVSLAAILIPISVLAQITEWRPDLIAKYESEGGQNLPNYLFDGPYGKRSAGGVCQMLTRNWLRVAPMIDIDIVKFPVAGTATEFDQWRACWKLWTLDGYGAWSCCNVKLRKVLAESNVPAAAPVRPRSTAQIWRASSSVAGKQTSAPVGVDPVHTRFSASSDVYSAPPRADTFTGRNMIPIFQ